MKQVPVLWTHRIGHYDFSRFPEIHTSVIFAAVWRFHKTCVEFRSAFFIAELITTETTPHSNYEPCIICKRDFSDVYVHACCNCSCTIYGGTR
jgi:hypothetical protein